MNGPNSIGSAKNFKLTLQRKGMHPYHFSSSCHVLNTVWTEFETIFTINWLLQQHKFPGGFGANVPAESPAGPDPDQVQMEQSRSLCLLLEPGLLHHLHNSLLDLCHPDPGPLQLLQREDRQNRGLLRPTVPFQRHLWRHPCQSEDISPDYKSGHNNHGPGPDGQGTLPTGSPEMGILHVWQLHRVVHLRLRCVDGRRLLSMLLHFGAENGSLL